MQKLLEKLISFESDQYHSIKIKKCFDYVVDDLRKAGLKLKTYSSNGKPSLIAGRKLKKHYRYILNGHLDVVPADYKNAFKPVVKNSRLYGRGAADMKGPDAVLIELMKDADLKNADVGLMLNSDEEIGGYNGADYLLNKKGYSCDCVVVPDGGDNFRLVLAEKGVIQMKITARGKAAHGSRPWLGENAIEKLLNIFREIKKEVPNTYPENRWLPTVNLGLIKGGDVINKVPDRAQMYLDFRYPRPFQKQKILNLLKETCRNDKSVRYAVVSEGAVMVTPKNDKYIKKIIKTAKKQKIKLKTTKEHGASDGRFFSAKGIPVIMFKPVCSQPHIDNEWIDLKSLDKFYRILKDFLLDG